MKETLEAIFDTAYNEYKEYETFYKNIAPQIKEQREQFIKFSQENQDNIDVLTDKLFDIETEPLNYQNDLLRLQTRLVHTYNAIKEAIEIPAEIKTEVEKFVLSKQIYTIRTGEAIEIDPEYNKKIREEGKKYYKQLLEQQFKKN